MEATIFYFHIFHTKEVMTVKIGLMYCIEYLEVNIDWLIEQIDPHKGFSINFSIK